MFYRSHIKLVACIMVAFLMTFIACAKPKPLPIPPSKLIKRHPEFTKENVLIIQKGMTEKDVEEIFGKPDEIDITLCGPDDGTFCYLLYMAMRLIFMISYGCILIGFHGKGSKLYLRTTIYIICSFR